MKILFAEKALLADGWARGVRIAVDDRGKISGVEKDKSYDAAADGEKLDIVIPGMVNAHSHAFQALMRGATDKRSDVSPNDDFWTWRETMYRYASQISPEEQRAAAREAYGEMLLAGYTGVAEFHYLHRQPDGASYDPPSAMADAVIAAAKDTGIALTFLPTLYQRGGFDGRKLSGRQQRFFQTTEEFLQSVKVLHEKCSAPNLHMGIALHSLRAVAPEEIKKVLTDPRVMRETFPIHIHAAEQVGEVEECNKHLGKRPVQWLMDELAKPDYAAFDKSRLVLIHATHATRDELAAAGKTGVTICYCPSTEAHLGDGIPEAVHWIGQGGAYAIGTDENGTINPFAELNLLESGQRLLHRKRLQLSPHGGGALWQQAAQGGAKAAGIACGAIAAGRRADLVALRQELFAGAPDVLDAAIFTPGIAQNPVRHTMVGGNWVVIDGRLVSP